MENLHDNKNDFLDCTCLELAAVVLLQFELVLAAEMSIMILKIARCGI